MPRMVVWYDENGEVFYFSDGGDIELLIIDERCQKDRVYLYQSHAAEPGAIDAMIGSSRIGRAGDMPGTEAAIRAMMKGEPPPKPKLEVVATSPVSSKD